MMSNDTSGTEINSARQVKERFKGTFHFDKLSVGSLNETLKHILIRQLKTT